MPRRQPLLEFAVLDLHESPMHGYELRKRLNLALRPFRALCSARSPLQALVIR